MMIGQGSGTSHDTAIVGAGLAGLAAARSLAAAGQSVKLLEALDFPGGRTRSSALAPGQREVDWGAEWLIPTLHRRMMALAREFDFELEEEDGATVWDVPGLREVARLKDLQALYPNFSAGMSAVQHWFDTPPAEDERNVSIGTLLRRLIPDQVARDLLEVAIYPLTGADPGEVSAAMLRGEIALHGGGLEGTFAPPSARLARTCGGLARALAESLPTGLLETGIRVARIVVEPDGTATAHAAGRSWRARHILLAVPVAALHHIAFDPPITTVGPDTSGRANAGEDVKIWAEIDGPPPPEHLSKRSPLRLAYSWVQDGTTLLCAHALARDIAGHDPATLLAKAFPGNPARRLGLQDWRAEPGFGASWMSARAGHDPAADFAPSFGPIRVIGGDVAPEWVGWMEGALASADAAVAELMS